MNLKEKKENTRFQVRLECFYFATHFPKKSYETIIYVGFDPSPKCGIRGNQEEKYLL
jgi:hypothetical protein